MSEDKPVVEDVILSRDRQVLYKAEVIDVVPWRDGELLIRVRIPWDTKEKRRP